MTPSELAAQALPTVQAALEHAQPEIAATVGPLKWMAVWPLWKTLTRANVLVILIRVGVELAVGWAAPWAVPMLDALIPLADRFLERPEDKQAFANVVSLLKTPVTHLSSPARMALARRA